MKFNFHHLPTLVCVWFAFCIILSYIVAVSVKSVYPFFPYISETGVEPPSSCVFGFLLNIAGFLSGIAFYVRYRQVDIAIETGLPFSVKRWNKASLVVGCVVVFGVLVVANFQANVEIKYIFMLHMMGALLSFGVGIIYLALQTVLTFKLQPYYEKYPNYGASRNIKFIRVFLLICYSVAFLLVFIFGTESTKKFKGDNTLWFTEEYEGYGYHLISTISEWLLTGMFLMYILTLTKELKAVSYGGIVFKSKLITKNDFIL